MLTCAQSVVNRLQDINCHICNTVHAFDSAKPTIGCSELILLAFKTSEGICYANGPKTEQTILHQWA